MPERRLQIDRMPLGSKLTGLLIGFARQQGISHYACMFLCAALLAQFVSPANAQTNAGEPASVREVIEGDDRTEQLIRERILDSSSEAADSTPLTAILSLTERFNAGDYAGAAAYMDLRYLPDELAEWTPEELIQAIVIVWDQQNILDYSALSDEPRGNEDDGLPLHLDLLGTLQVGGEQIPFYLQSVPQPDGTREWKISSASVERVPELWEEWGYSPLALYLQGALPDFSLGGIANWQLLFIGLFVLLAWPISIFASEVLLRLTLLIPNAIPDAIGSFFRHYVRFFIFVLLARELIEQLNLPIKARIFLISNGINYIAFTVLLMGLLSLVRDYQVHKLQSRNLMQYAALFRPITTVIKILVLAVIGLFWAESAGYNMTTVLAGLGIGSLAVALAAQKTLENVFGALTLYLARPVKAGDFCRFGDVLGTVEEIGLRSTTIRTLDNTLVFVPNSEFSSSRIENITARSTIRFNQQLRVKLAGEAAIENFLSEIRALYSGQEGVLDDTVSVHFKEIEEDTAVVRINLQVATQSYNEYLDVGELLNLRTIAVARANGLALCGPTLGVNLTGDRLEHV